MEAEHIYKRYDKLLNLDWAFPYYLVRVVEILSIERGKQHSEYAIALDNLGKTYHLQGKMAFIILI